ncbi:MAG: hypothetical protein FJ034_00835 [Chloroflexi bacterium]|nr:hypothetical protein [Chloroflexota bacterium]
MDLNSEATPPKKDNLAEFLFKTVDGSKWEVPDAPFDFAGFYDWMIDCRHLLVPKTDMTWIHEQKVEFGRPVDVFVNMSCGSQLAPHITMEIPGVLRALGVTFTAGSGRQFCCGKIYKTRDKWDAGEKMGQMSIDRFLGWGAKTAVHQCHSCQIVYSEYTERVPEAAPGMTNVHMSTFIEQRLLELGDKVPWRKRLDYRVLVEGFGPELSSVHYAATQAELRMLALVPGVQVLGMVEPPTRGAPCKTNVPAGPSVLAFLSDAEREEVKRELEEQAARRGGADVISPNAHYCQREWSKFSTPKLAVKSWISILAEALGCSYPDRSQEYWS